MPDVRVPACHRWELPTHLDPKLPSLGKLFAWQRGRCAICGVSTAACVVDHDHVTGFVRGLLCSTCNLAEGVRGARDDPFADYRRRPPTAIVGVALPYRSGDRTYSFRCDRYLSYLSVPSAWSPGATMLTLLDDPSDPTALARAIEEHESHSPGLGDVDRFEMVAFACVRSLRRDGTCRDQRMHLEGEPPPGTAVFAPTRAARAQGLTGTLASGRTMDVQNHRLGRPPRGAAPLWQRLYRA
ncbi:endonuclease domain-containing protein [Streptomyces sp. Da 82-17]|uniref:endonuclease domain-containing protein n=1 Tax=Streptomyces sp. Da 82-17 TaxID=3377116 RepID=UPI0038D38F06